MKTEFGYIVTNVTGCFVGQVEVGQRLIEKEDKGLEYEWVCIDPKTEEVLGTITGKYDGKVFVQPLGK